MEENPRDVDMSAPACRRCFMLVAPFAPQVVGDRGIYHRECYEAWYFGRYGQRPRLTAGTNGDRHRFTLRESAAA
jgi:hypothetical protein